jgi:hypothetical protein
MATVNHYFQSGRTIGRASEQNLYEDLIIESMKIYGFEVYYLTRKPYNEDNILTEDYLNTYDNAYPIEMYMQNVGGFEGDGELLTKFGIEIRDTANFIVSRKRWENIVGKTGTSVLLRPAEGDIIYFPLTKSFFEIRKVDNQEPFFQIGKLYVYTLRCELMQFSNERFETGISEIDNAMDILNFTVDNFEFLNEDGDSLLLETASLTPLVLENYTVDTVTAAADNELFETEAADVLDFSERNPFGEVLR